MSTNKDQSVKVYRYRIIQVQDGNGRVFYQMKRRNALGIFVTRRHNWLGDPVEAHSLENAIRSCQAEAEYLFEREEGNRRYRRSLKTKVLKEHPLDVRPTNGFTTSIDRVHIKWPNAES